MKLAYGASKVDLQPLSNTIVMEIVIAFQLHQFITFLECAVADGAHVILLLFFHLLLVFFALKMADLILWHAFTERIVTLFHVPFNKSQIVMVFSVSLQLLYLLHIVTVPNQRLYYSFLTLGVSFSLRLLPSSRIELSSIAIERPRHSDDVDWIIRTSLDWRSMWVYQIWIP